MVTFSLALLLFFVLDPFGNLVPVNAILSKLPPEQRSKVILREAGIATLILILSAFLGGKILHILELKEHSLRLSGGIVLFLIALGMLFPSRSVLDEKLEGAPLIFPIAMPLIAGPSAISMAILFAEENPISVVAGAVLTASLASTVILAASPKIYGWLGSKGVSAIERLMGMLLIMISVQMFLDGIDAYIANRG